MLARALVVLLVVLNLGAALWWALRAPPSPPPAFEPPPGVARLRLLDQAPVPVRQTAAAAPAAASASSPAAPAAPAASEAAPAAAERCYRFGPFAGVEAAQAARVLLQPVVRRARAREDTAGGARGWRVFLPPAADAQAAQATAQRIAAAGFDDYYVIRDGAEANAIALGRYRNEDGARRRAQALVAAGFPARVEALGGRSRVWLDVAAEAGFDPAKAGAAVAAPFRRIDCAPASGTG